ncbi:MAG: hypothetical protein NT157_03605 [Candidatus Micrarchaeota archaeon]|nr:hypothetical protein [Candidatus Micrarchaeota archaeon]
MDFKRALVFLIGLAPRLVFSLGCVSDGQGGCVDTCTPEWFRGIKSFLIQQDNVRAIIPLLAIALSVLGLVLIFLHWQEITKKKEYSKYGIILLALGVLLFLVGATLQYVLDLFTCFS